MSSRRQIRIFLACSIGLYLAVRVGLAGYAELALRLQDTRANNRLANVRIIPREAVPAVLDIYIGKISRTARNVVFFGDSQTYGFGRHPQQTCAAALQNDPAVNQAGMEVHNLAIVDGRHRDSLRILEALNRAQVKLDTIVLSANPTHFVKAAPFAPDADNYIPRVAHPVSVFRSLLLTRDNVFDLANVSWRNTRKLHPIDLFDDLVKTSESHVFAEVGAAYCADVEPSAALPDLLALMAAAKKSAARVIFYTQPRYYAEHLQAPHNYDWHPQVVDKAVLAAARDSRCDVVLDLGDAFPRDHFSDLIHLSQKGHEALKALLLPHLLPVPGSGTGASAP